MLTYKAGYKFVDGGIHAGKLSTFLPPSLAPAI